MAKKIILKICVGIFFAILLILPLVMMFSLSKQEISKYEVNTNYTFKEAAYGEIKRVTRQDLKLYYTFSGTVTSNSYKYIRFPESESAEVTSTLSMGDEVFVGDVLAHIGNKEIKSAYNGVIEDVASYAGGYVKIRSFDELQLSCNANMSTINKVKDCETLQLSNGNKVNVEKVSNMITDNKGEIVFSIENSDYMYGQEVNNLKIYTGKVYKNVLILDKDCIYQKNENGPYYVRVVNENGIFQGEKEVEIGFEAGNVVSVQNIEEDTLCDAGYKALLETQVE